MAHKSSTMAVVAARIAPSEVAELFGVTPAYLHGAQMHGAQTPTQDGHKHNTEGRINRLDSSLAYVAMACRSAPLLKGTRANHTWACPWNCLWGGQRCK